MTDLAVEQTRKLPRYPVLPAALLFDAIARAIPTDAAVFTLFVDARDKAAARFYRHHGFQAFSGRAARLFLPVAIARRVVEG
jgi:hypothetical protein